MNLTIGISPCPNDVFIFSGLLLGKISTDWTADFHFDDVETLNRMAQRGEYDLIKISYANFPLCPEYRLLRCGGALGRGCGPLLLTGGEAWNPEAETLVPGEHTTANFLLDFWAERPLRKRFVSFDALYRELCAWTQTQGVVIHENRFTYARDGLNLVHDLGEHWERATGHPIPLGALAYGNGRAGAQPDLPAAEAVEQAVRASLDWAWAHEAEALALCARYSQSMEPDVIKAHVGLYVNEFTRDLGEAGGAAVDFFLSRLAASK